MFFDCFGQALLFGRKLGHAGGVGVGLGVEGFDFCIERFLFGLGLADGGLQGLGGLDGLGGFLLALGDLFLSGKDKEQEHRAETTANAVHKGER